MAFANRMVELRDRLGIPSDRLAAVLAAAAGAGVGLLAALVPAEPLMLTVMGATGALAGWIAVRRGRRLLRASLTDGLTSLWNRRAFDDRLREEIARATRHGHALSLVMVDADGLKAHNDGLGHRHGDRVLAELATTVMCCCRGSDVVARYGGDEIAILAPATTAAGAALLGERIRSAVERRGIGGNARRRLTVSVGVADLVAAGGTNHDLLVELADRALYRAKEQGKNRVVVACPRGDDDGTSGIFRTSLVDTSSRKRLAGR
jgi:diguanylate cyclase (GGDEF)-like protein